MAPPGSPWLLLAPLALPGSSGLLWLMALLGSSIIASLLKEETPFGNIQVLSLSCFRFTNQDWNNVWDRTGSTMRFLGPYREQLIDNHGYVEQYFLEDVGEPASEPAGEPASEPAPDLQLVRSWQPYEEAIMSRRDQGRNQEPRSRSRPRPA